MMGKRLSKPIVSGGEFQKFENGGLEESSVSCNTRSEATT